MADEIEIGVDDLTAVACAIVRDRLAGIDVDGSVIPTMPGQVYPEDARDLPVILVHSPQETYEQGAGRVGNRMQRINCVIRVTVVFALPITQLAAFDRKVGQVRSEIKRRLAADPHLKIDGSVVASDVALQRVDKGFSGGGSKTVVVNQLQYGCTIHAREGSDLPAHF